MKSNGLLKWLGEYAIYCILWYGGAFILGALLFTSCDSNTGNSNSSGNNNGGVQGYSGYCRIVGTYRNRYVECYGNYSPSAYNRAHAKANECNRNAEPIGGCTGIYE